MLPVATVLLTLLVLILGVVWAVAIVLVVGLCRAAARGEARDFSVLRCEARRPEEYRPGPEPRLEEPHLEEPQPEDVTAIPTPDTSAGR
jgi:hypothetical protein